jgi:hypothetical protein
MAIALRRTLDWLECSTKPGFEEWSKPLFTWHSTSGSIQIQ